MTIQRYDVYADHDYGTAWVDWEEANDGDWIKWEDVKDLLERAAAILGSQGFAAWDELAAEILNTGQGKE